MNSFKVESEADSPKSRVITAANAKGLEGTTPRKEQLGDNDMRHNAEDGRLQQRLLWKAIA
jgi:hypothetical protein